jgi:hypothetical protein
MVRQLDFYSPGNESAKLLIERTEEQGARSGLIVGSVKRPELIGYLSQTTISWIPVAADKLTPEAISAVDAVLIVEHDSAAVACALHACVGHEVAVIAPLTEHHFSRRTIFLLSMPKAGTHMVIRLLTLMGLERSSDRAPIPGTWSTPVGYEYHAPCRELLSNDWFDPVGRRLLFRSPSLFVYRDPRDIVVSELDWFSKPEHAFSSYLHRCADQSERLERLISDDTVIGTIRDRVKRYVGWLHFSNVIPVSYEELVGSRGGGSDLEQCATIWSLQLKLQIPGSPHEYAKRLYDPSSPTFSQGRIGRHREFFAARHHALFNALPQDFMEILGYDSTLATSLKVSDRRYAPLIVKSIPPDLLYSPRLVRQGVMGLNIVELAGSYYSVRQGQHLESAVAGEDLAVDHPGFATLRDAIDAALQSSEDGSFVRGGEGDDSPVLVAEGYCGFNIVRLRNRWYGFDQAVGPLSHYDLGESNIELMKCDGTCVGGDNVADVKAEILLRMVKKLEQVSQRQAEQCQDLYTGFTQDVENIRARLPNWLADVGLAAGGPPRLLDDGYRGFSLIAYDHRVWAVQRGVGPIDLSDELRRESFVHDGKIIAAYTIRDARMAVDQWCSLQSLWQQEMGRFQDVVTDLIATVRQSMEMLGQELQRDLAQGLDGLRQEELAARRQGEQVVGEALGDVQRRMELADRQVAQRIDDEVGRLNERFSASARALEEAVDEWHQALVQLNRTMQNQIDDLKRNWLARLRAFLYEKKIRLGKFRAGKN